MFQIKDKVDHAEVYIYGEIGKSWWNEDATSAEDFATKLNELTPKPLDIRIDSGGGDVYEAFAICSAIQRYEGDTTAYIDGLAASAASYIAVVCDRVVMNDYAFLMIHNAWTYCSGNADYLESCVARLRQIDETLAAIYEKRSTYTLDEIKNLMNEETWFTADEALEHGLAQEVVVTKERMAACLDSETAKHYRNVPDAISVKSAISHPVNKLDEKVEEPKASYLVIDGRIFRKEAKSE